MRRATACIFLENNRDLGVKNGMLGNVAGVWKAGWRRGSTAPRGRGRAGSVRVVADYAAIDHGYATTIHKSQGATVDRAYVLSPAHGPASCLCRDDAPPRVAATLYAGRDEFRGLAASVRAAWSRRPKETTLDYAERRGIAPRSEIVVPREAQRAERSLGEAAPEPSRARETQAEAPAAKRGMFAGLDPAPADHG